MNKNVLITIKKELRSIFRDKKTITRMLLFPLIIPAMIILYGTMYENIENQVEEFKIGTNYQISEAENEILKSLNIATTEYQTIDDLKESYKNNDIEGYITYDESSKKYTIYTDSSTTSGMTLSAYIEEYLKGYQTYLTNKYLIEHEINLEEAYNNFEISFQDLSNRNYMLEVLLTVSLTYIIMSICLSTSNMATGATATEKENGTLETILTFPIKKTELIVGKYLSSVIVGFISALISLILMIISILIAKDAYTMFESFELILSFKSIVGSLIIILCASLFIAGAALALTCFSKTYKEAQSASQSLNMICLIPMFVSLVEITINHLYYLIPICNYEQILMDLFTNSVDLVNITITSLSTIVYITIVITYIIKAYNSEKILFTK